MTEDLNRVIRHLQDLRMRIALTRALLETTRKMLISPSTESTEDPQENEANQKIPKNNRAKKPKARKTDERTIGINEDLTENRKNKKKHAQNDQYVLNAPPA